MSFWGRLFDKHKTELIGLLAALVLIFSGLIIPLFIPDQLPQAPPGYEDATWVKNLISLLLIGMGILCFAWLFVIHRHIVRRSKKDYLY
jgi:hydrogenase-4 membrane subunit HyfE